MGRLLNSNLCNAGVLEEAKVALDELGYDLDELLEEEHDMGLGNGGLGRLAACFLDSMATMDLPAIGYGIHYQFGLFRQSFDKGRQVEKPDDYRKVILGKLHALSIHKKLSCMAMLSMVTMI